MDKTLGGFRAALLLGWVALSAAGLVYARGKGIPLTAALPLLAAILVEYPFYLLPGFARLRERVPARALPLLLLGSMLAPYLVYAVGTGQFRWAAFLQLVGLALVLSFWYEVLPHGWPADLGFLAVLASVLLGRQFNRIYTAPFPDAEASILGHLALIHVAAMALLVQRRMEDARYGFWPNAREWRAGALGFLLLLPVGFPLALALGAVRAAQPAPWWKIGGIFLGILWVVALSEEFFFRGILQRRMAQATGRPWLALAAVSLFFGAVHLPFRGFPNWRFALVAAAAGAVYGLVYQRTGSIRASMVTHALAVAAWKGFLA